MLHVYLRNKNPNTNVLKRNTGNSNGVSSLTGHRNPKPGNIKANRLLLFLPGPIYFLGVDFISKWKNRGFFPICPDVLNYLESNLVTSTFRKLHPF